MQEELAARKADTSHLKQLTTDQKGQIEHLKRTLDNTSAQLREAQQHASQLQLDRQHYEREVDRLQEEAGRTAAELNKTAKVRPRPCRAPTTSCNRTCTPGHVPPLSRASAAGRVWPPPLALSPRLQRGIAPQHARQRAHANLQELERLKDWTEVLKRVEADKLREEQDARAKERLEIEAQKAAIDKALAAAEARAAHAEERAAAAAREADGVRKQLGLANVNGKNLQQQVSELTGARAALQRQREEDKAQLGKLQAALQAAQLAAAQHDKDKVLALSQAKEDAAAERAKLVAAADEATREVAVHKALADGWSRDLREAQERLKEEQARAAELQRRVEELQGGVAGSFKDAASAEATIKALQAQVEGQTQEMRRVKVEYTSERKRLEKVRRMCTGWCGRQLARRGWRAGPRVARAMPCCVPPAATGGAAARVQRERRGGGAPAQRRGRPAAPAGQARHAAGRAGQPQAVRRALRLYALMMGMRAPCLNASIPPCLFSFFDTRRMLGSLPVGQDPPSPKADALGSVRLPSMPLNASGARGGQLTR